MGRCSRSCLKRSAIWLAKHLPLVGFVALMFYYDARLAIVCLTGAPLIVYPLIRLGQRVRRTTHRSQEALEQLSHLSAEAFTGHRIVKAFGTESLRGPESSSAPLPGSFART